MVRRSVGVTMLLCSGAMGFGEQRQATFAPRLPTAGWGLEQFDQLNVPYDSSNPVNPTAFLIGDQNGDGQLSANGNGEEEIYDQWHCGNRRELTGAPGLAGTQIAEGAVNSKAGIQLLKGKAGMGTLDWVKDAERGQVPDVDQQSDWYKMSFSSLFCADYVGKYRNPRSTNFAGVCIRDNTKGNRWRSIVQADREAKAAWEYFGNILGSVVTPLTAENGGYQKATPEYRPATNNSWNTRWGSGGYGSLPPNWCAEYMKEMICHISFPQYAGPTPTDQAAWIAGNTPYSASDTNIDQRHVRPVCGDWCGSIMDLCNRAEPRYDQTEGTTADYAYPWLQDNYTGMGLLKGYNLQNLSRKIQPGENYVRGNLREYGESNGFWCDIWNSGYHIAQAGTGVGYGSDQDLEGPEDSSRFCASWNAAPGFAPALGFLAAAAAATLAVLQ
eukprot:TRINITY_DN1004_c0_g3_i1.p2 TRINITY_DN1004_c0_g3~~TRINITY_DN1004_c0_g3_i1.p2  ORF type:complete len:442 (+),score=157.20 TRINITY_DN1004_c0_g3_i1:99-1424(+)